MPAPLTVNGKQWYTRKEAARYLRQQGLPIEHGTLANLATNGNRRKGPPFYRFRQNLVLYRQEDLDHWWKSKLVRYE